MDLRRLLFPSVLGLTAAGFAVFSLSRGQDRAAPLQPAPVKSAVSSAPTTAVAPDSLRTDFAKLPPLQQQMFLAAQRGADWLCRANQSDGRFLHGFLPALRTPLEGDHYLRQVGAAFALARAAHFLGQQRYAAVARQAVLTLLLETAPDPQDTGTRHTILSSTLINRLGAAGLLILAINELPSPGDDLLEQSEQLCAFIRKQQRSDGSLSYTDPGMEAETDPEGINYYP
ncbi:MAG TPA: hypothetical protein VKU02_05520, partial [Gemmataceae bacterium]|nr:hypothetical protein [Gemmataceae bacterium]